MFPQPNYPKYIAYLLILIALGWFSLKVWGNFTEGYRAEGRAEVQKLWDEAKDKERRALEEVQAKLDAAEQSHQKKVEELSDELSKAEGKYQADLAVVRAELAQRLRASEDRSAIYHRQAAGSAAEQASLASHAARLDRSLTEGISLVGELRATIEQRDESLKLLGRQIKADRELLEEIPDGK